MAIEGPAHYREVDFDAGTPSVWQVVECGTDRGVCKQMLTPDGKGTFFTGTETDDPNFAEASITGRKAGEPTKQSLAIAKLGNDALAKVYGPLLKAKQAQVKDKKKAKTLAMYVILNEKGVRPAYGIAGERRHPYRNYPLWLLILRHLLMPWRRD